MNFFYHNSYCKRMPACFILAVVIFPACVFAQQRAYSVANAHAHNDYNHPVPFYTAYEAGFGSIEADILLADNQLYVAHSSFEIAPQKTLQSLYLDPLQKAVQKNKGYVYADSTKNLLLLIDIKTKAQPTLDLLLNVLQSYKTVTGCPRLKIVITGNQPDPSRFTSYPGWLFFDGNLNESYAAETLNKIALFSDNFRKYTLWNGEGVPVDSAGKIKAAVTKAHSLNKPIRFWAAPDMPNAWTQLIKWDVDYINTDKIDEISVFLKQLSSHSPRRRGKAADR